MARPLQQAAARWLAAETGATIRQDTADAYFTSVDAHLAPFFDPRGGIDGVNLTTTLEYIKSRLRSVKARTLRKELTALRGLLLSEGLNPKLLVADIPDRAKGTANPRGRRMRTPVSPDEAWQIIRKLPALDRFKQVVRLRYAIAYLTSLRPRTLVELSVPEHWTAGQKYVRVFDELDKTGNGRIHPIDRRTRLILWVLTDGGRRRGKVFGDNPDHRDVLKKVACKVLGERGRTFQRYDWRRNQLTHLSDSGAPPGVVQAIGGHKLLSTTAVYIMTNERAAELFLGKRK